MHVELLNKVKIDIVLMYCCRPAMNEIDRKGPEARVAPYVTWMLAPGHSIPGQTALHSSERVSFHLLYPRPDRPPFPSDGQDHIYT